MVWSPQLNRVAREGGADRYELGHELVDAFLEFASGRARPNTVRAYADDLKAFFTVVAKDPVDVTPADVMAFVTEQRQPRPGAENVVHVPDGGPGWRRRRSCACSWRSLPSTGICWPAADTTVVSNPVPRGLPTGAPAESFGVHPWCEECAVCLGSSTPRTQLPSLWRCAPDAIGPSSKRCSSAASAVARRSGFGLRTSASASVESSSPRARVATSAWRRCRPRSSPAWPTTWSASGPSTRRPTDSSSCWRPAAVRGGL